MGLISSLMKDILGTDVGLGDLYQNIGTTGQQAQAGATELAGQLPGMTAFKPFTVTSGTSQVMTTPEGGFNIGLSPQALANQQALQSQANYYMTQPVQGLQNVLASSQQAFNLANDPNRVALTGPNAYQGYTDIQNQAGSLASQFLQRSGMPTGMREQDVYNRIRAVQTPEEERQRMALEERLAAQGRLGVQTNMYGGTPEQLAMSKAQTEAQNQAALMAMQQAQQEQAQQAALGSQFGGLMGQTGAQRQSLMSQNLQDLLAAQQMGAGLAGTGYGLQQAQQQLGLGALGASYLPEQQALGMLSAAAPYASIADIGRRQGAGLFGETYMSGLDALMAGQLGQANLVGGIIPGVVQGLGNIVSTGIEGLISKI